MAILAEIYFKITQEEVAYRTSLENISYAISDLNNTEKKDLFIAVATLQKDPRPLINAGYPQNTNTAEKLALFHRLCRSNFLKMEIFKTECLPSSLAKKQTNTMRLI